MSFTLANWACISESLNQGQELVVPFLGTATVLNAPNVFFYGSPNDTVATIIAANYFLPQYASLRVGDWIMGNGTDASFAVKVTAVSSSSVIVVSTGLTTSIGTANILDDAVTNAKIAMGAVDSNSIAESIIQYVPIGVTSAQFLGMYAAPKLIIGNPGANKQIIVDAMALSMSYNSAAYAAGGVVALQYDSTANGAGVLATAEEAAADFFAAASTTFRQVGSLAVAPNLTTVNKGIYLSNKTGAFTTGNSAFVAHVWYHVIDIIP